MTNLGRILATAALLLSACAHAPPPTAEPRFPHLVKAREEIEKARGHVKAAEDAHSSHGGLGGHGGAAVRALDAAQGEIDAAIAYARDNNHGGAPGEVTPKPELTMMPDDSRYPNLGEARLETERAVRNLEDAEQFHAPIGTLGGHAKKAVEASREALHAISEAEHFADEHR